MEKLRVGIIGVGGMGSGHLSRFTEGKVKNAEITALCDIDPEHLYRHKDSLPETVQYFENSDDLIHSGLVDGVIIATPHYDHPLIAIEAFKAGLHVLTEKPAGVYTKKVREMNEAAKASGKAFQIDFLVRTNPFYRKLKEIMDSGEMGQLKRIVWIITDWYRTQAYYDMGTWRATWAGEGGGTLLNQNPHQLDLFQWMVGMPKRVRGFCYFGKRRNIEVEDDATAYFEFENGAVGTYITSVSEFPGTNRLEISCDYGKIVYEDGKIKMYKTEIAEPEFNRTTANAFDSIPLEVTEVPVENDPDHDGLSIMINNWVAAALTGEPLIAPGEEGINSLSISNAVYLSQWTDDWVELPVDEDLFYEHLQEKIRTSTFVKGEIKKVNQSVEGTFHK